MFLKLQGNTGGIEMLIGLQPVRNFYIQLQDYDYVSDQIEIQFPQTIVFEETTFTLTAYFRTRATSAASTPTTIHYRIDCLSTKRPITDWTAVSSPATQNNIVITATENRILDDAFNTEVKQITIKLDDGLSTQVMKPATWRVRNLQGTT